MIKVSDADGSRELFPLFHDGCSLEHLEHGDFTFYGIWEDDEVVSVCIERKRLLDLIQCMHDGRHMDQVRAAANAGFDFMFVFFEIDIGEYRIDPDRDLQWVHKGRNGQWYPLKPKVDFIRTENYLNQLELYLGVRRRDTLGPMQTVASVMALHDMFQLPPSEHKSLERFRVMAPPRLDLLGKPTLLRRVAKELPGIGWDRSQAVEDKFGSVLKMTEASVEDWESILGIGPTTAMNAFLDIRKDWRNVRV